MSVAVYAVGSGAGLGAWTLDLTVDPQAVRVVGCSVPAGGVCNVAYGPGQVRVAGASAAGVPAEQPLVILTLLPMGPGGLNGVIGVVPVAVAAADGTVVPSAELSEPLSLLTSALVREQAAAASLRPGNGALRDVRG